MKVAIITGVLGQDGYYLANQLLNKGYRVIGTTRKNPRDLEKTGTEDWTKKITLVQLDLTDEYKIFELVKKFQPAEIYLLGGVSSVFYSHQFPAETVAVNTISTINFLRAANEYSNKSKILLASSAEIFGYGKSEKLCEDSSYSAGSPYGISKLASHLFVDYYRKHCNVFVSSAILFNHESARRGDEFVTKKIIRTLVDLVANQGPNLAIGNLDVCRDWGFAPEYTEGMHLALQNAVPQDFVFATGEVESIRTFITEAASVLGMDLVWSGSGLNEIATDRATGREVVYVDPQFFRPVDANVMMGDPGRAFEVLGWKAETKLPGIVKEMIASERESTEKAV